MRSSLTVVKGLVNGPAAPAFETLIKILFRRVRVAGDLQNQFMESVVRLRIVAQAGEFLFATQLVGRVAKSPAYQPWCVADGAEIESWESEKLTVPALTFEDSFFFRLSMYCSRCATIF